MKKTKIICSIAMVTGFILIGCGGGSKEGGSSSSFSSNNSDPTINSLDTNNNTIQITDSKEEITLAVKENIRNAFNVKASDEATQVTYSLTGDDFNEFDMDKYSGKTFFRSKTDYEKKSQYHVSIVVTDAVGNTKNQKVVIVVIDDKNEIAPQPVINQNDTLDNAETDYFITTWKTDNIGTSNNNQIVIPTLGDGYNYNVDWGDGTSSKHITIDGKHTYEKAGTYKVKISGDFPRIFFAQNIDFNSSTYSNDADKIIAINQWGTNKWKSMRGAFTECTRLIGKASDIPDLSETENMNGMFAFSSFNQNIGQWDTSNVIHMLGVFWNNQVFNQDISQWDTSNVIDMRYMFERASNFNQNISNWNVSNVTDMSEMFRMASSFKYDLTNWNILINTKRYEMFTGADALRNLPYWYNIDFLIKQRDVIFVVSHAESKTCTVAETVDDFNKNINNKDNLAPIFQNIDMDSFITSVKTEYYSCSSYGRESDAIGCFEFDAQEASLTTCVLGYNHKK